MKIVDVQDIPQTCELVDLGNLPKVHKLVSELTELCEQEKGIGISAAQVGVNQRLFLVKSDQEPWIAEPGHYGCFVNCEYKRLGKSFESVEGCLSLKNETGFRQFKVDRSIVIHLTGFQLKDMQFEKVDRIVAGFPAIVFQHEIDHQFGILISDIGVEC